MNHDIPPELERYLALCQRIYERMERDGSWPWKDDPDSPDFKDVVESADNPKNV